MLTRLSHSCLNKAEIITLVNTTHKKGQRKKKIEDKCESTKAHRGNLRVGRKIGP